MLVLHFSSPWKLKAGKQRRWFGVRLRNRKKESCLENSSWLTQTTQSSCFSCQGSKNWITPLSGWNLKRNGYFIILWSLISTIQPSYLAVKLQRKQGDVVWYKQSALRKSEILQGRLIWTTTVNVPGAQQLEQNSGFPRIQKRQLFQTLKSQMFILLHSIPLGSGFFAGLNTGSVNNCTFNIHLTSR